MSENALVMRCAAGGIRTPNLLIRSQMLYPLSYGCWLRRVYREPVAARESIEDDGWREECLIRRPGSV